jgi:Glycosyl transferase family 2
MVYNEPVLLPIWLRYYSRFFAPPDIYVFDNDSTDGSTARDGFVRIPARRDRVDAIWTLQTIQALQHELMRTYDVVLVTDVDEIVVPVPQLGTLGEYLDRFDEEWVNCLGYELLHQRDREPPLDQSSPVMSQRSYWFANGAYDKAAVTTVPLQWRAGFHGRADYQYNLDPDLRLIHLHRMDFDICLERHRSRQDRRWADLDERERWALHNRITDEAEFARWFYEDSCFEGLEIKLEEIPPAWHGVF